jgi:hypothetical protein
VIATVIITGGKTLPEFGSLSEAESFKEALSRQLDAIIAVYKEQDIELIKPQIWLETEALDSYRNLANSLRMIKDRLGDETASILYICDEKHGATPRLHWKREARELGAQTEELIFTVKPCHRPYDRHPFNIRLLQDLHSLILFVKAYRQHQLRSQIRLDVGIRDRVRRFPLWKPKQ